MMYANSMSIGREWIKTNVVSLRLHGNGYYCDECMKVFAEFEER